jgi:hypothetical protein
MGGKGVLALLVLATAGAAFGDSFTVVDRRVDPVDRRCSRATAPTGTPAAVLQSFTTMVATGPSITQAWCDGLAGGGMTGHGSLAPPCPSMSCAPSDTAVPGGCKDDDPARPCYPATTYFYVPCWPLDPSLSGSTVVTGGTWSGGRCTVHMTRTCTYSSEGAVFAPSGGVADCVQ